MILWYATRTGRRLHLGTIGGNRSICNRATAELICSAIAGHDQARHQDGRPTCRDCVRVATQIQQAATA